MSNLVQSMLNILKAPVVGSVDIKHLFLLIGLVIIMIVAWIMILRALDTVAEEI